MKVFLLSFMIPLFTSPVLAAPDTEDLRQEIGWFKGTDTAVGVSKIYTSVHRLRLQNGGTCSSVVNASMWR